jgi:hypothetical protein
MADRPKSAAPYREGSIPSLRSEHMYDRRVPMLAGVPVAAELVRELADRVAEPSAGTLEAALDAGRAVIALTVADRERILRILEDCLDGLTEPAGVLLRA